MFVNKKSFSSNHIIRGFIAFFCICFLLIFLSNTTLKIKASFYLWQNVIKHNLIPNREYDLMIDHVVTPEIISEEKLDICEKDSEQEVMASIPKESNINVEEIRVVFNLYENLPKDKIKSYMSYKAITLKSSDQYKLQQIAYTDENGFRKVGDRYCVAVGSYFTNVIGTYLDIILSDGTIIECVLADQKADKHTDASNILASDGSLVEFVIDKNVLDKKVRSSGDVSNLYETWRNHVKKVIVYEEMVEEF